ncbi:MAG: hypothetical protein ACR2JY_01165 [Chloroflexota bacterium]
MPDTITDDELPLHLLRRVLPDWLTRKGAIVDQDIREGKFQRSLAVIAAISSVFSGWEVTSEHYRGSYSQRVMYSPLLLSGALLLAGLGGAINRTVARTVMPIVSVATMLDGLIGFFFHVRGIKRKPGGWRIPVFNIVMGPPLFAPLLFALSGYLGVIASLLRREDAPSHPVIAELTGDHHPEWLDLLPAPLAERGRAFEGQAREGLLQRHLAAATAISAFLSCAEALYSHYKNNFRYWYEWTPIALGPVLIAGGVGAVASRRLARTLLPIASVLAMLDGAAGSFFHMRGVVRRPGGLKTPLYNWIHGPPIFAPLLFAASGFLGLLASLLRRSDS